MKTRFQNLPFKCNLQRYTVEGEGGDIHHLSSPVRQGKRAKQGAAAVNGAKGGDANASSSAVGGAAYDDVCASAERLFDAIRCHVVRDIAPTALRAGFLTPCRDRLPTAGPAQLSNSHAELTCTAVELLKAPDFNPVM